MLTNMIEKFLLAHIQSPNFTSQFSIRDAGMSALEKLLTAMEMVYFDRILTTRPHTRASKAHPLQY